MTCLGDGPTLCAYLDQRHIAILAQKQIKRQSNVQTSVTDLRR
jgi:hypothetical protein